MTTFAIAAGMQALIALTPAVIAGLGGYYAARLQYRAADRNRNEARREDRLQAYRALLDAMLGERHLWFPDEGPTNERVLAAERKMNERLSAVFLVGTPDVVREASKWSQFTSDLHWRLLNAQSGGEDLRRQFHRTIRVEYEQYLGAVVDAMRRDVDVQALGGLPVDWSIPRPVGDASP